MSQPNKPTLTMQAAVAEYEPADDVTDLDTALRLITCLRQMITEIGKEHEPVEGQYAIFLDDEHERKAQLLYDKKRLLVGRDASWWLDPPEFDEVLDEFVEESIDLLWDMAHLEEYDGPPITASA